MSYEKAGSVPPRTTAEALPVAQAVPVQQQGGQQVPVAVVYTTQQQPVYQQRVVIAPGLLGRNPQRLVCPYCGADVVTATASAPGPSAHLWALLLCFVGCWPCCLLPYCMPECQDTLHTCPNCRRAIGESRVL